MKLLQSLTDFLTDAGIKNLESWAEDGTLRFSPISDESGFTVRYMANFEVSQTTTDPATLFALIVSWVMKNNVERQQQGLPAPEFFSERLDGKEYDLGVRIQFEEDYAFEAAENGKWQIGDQRFDLVGQAKANIDDADGDILQIVDSHTQDIEMQS